MQVYCVYVVLSGHKERGKVDICLSLSRPDDLPAPWYQFQQTSTTGDVTARIGCIVIRRKDLGENNARLKNLYATFRLRSS
jgi:hypothetical protein